MFPRLVKQWTSSKCLSAQEMGVNLKQGYNGDLTSRESGDLGGQMVKEGVSHANSALCKKQPGSCWTSGKRVLHSGAHGLERPRRVCCLPGLWFAVFYLPATYFCLLDVGFPGIVIFSFPSSSSGRKLPDAKLFRSLYPQYSAISFLLPGSF